MRVMQVIPCLALALLLGAVPVSAGELDPMHNKDQIMDSLDADKNGQLSQDEADNKKVFKTLDKDGDKKVSKKEYSILFNDPQVAEEQFRRMDRDGSGFITDDETVAPLLTIRF